MNEKKKRNTDIIVESGKPNLSKGDDEKFKSHKYMADKKKGFNDSLRKALDKKGMFVFLFLLTSIANASEYDPACDGQLLDRQAYTLCYDKETKNAYWTSYSL